MQGSPFLSEYRTGEWGRCLGVRGLWCGGAGVIQGGQTRGRGWGDTRRADQGKGLGS